MNDWHSPKPAFQNNLRRSFERLLRKLLNYPNFPAVVLVHAYIWYQVGAPGSDSVGVRIIPGRGACDLFGVIDLWCWEISG